MQLITPITQVGGSGDTDDETKLFGPQMILFVIRVQTLESTTSGQVISFSAAPPPATERLKEEADI